MDLSLAGHRSAQPGSGGQINETKKDRDFSIRRWTVDDGLPQNRISKIAQTEDGYLWLGTWFGLVRFDGVQFTLFNRYNTPALRTDAVNALAAGPDGALWVERRIV